LCAAQASAHSNSAPRKAAQVESVETTPDLELRDDGLDERLTAAVAPAARRMRESALHPGDARARR